MLSDCPDPVEVADFHFLQLRTLRITKKSSGPLGNVLAASSKYGLLFVGTEEGFLVLQLETVLTLDEDKENRSIVENFTHDFVPSSGTPTLIAVNFKSQAIVAVCASNNTIHFYNISSYSGVGQQWQPFHIAPTSSGVRDLVWNPASDVFALLLTNGTLQLWEIEGTVCKVVASLQDTNITSVCWSPKGKQLVAGKANGTFTQYKPNLSEVKTVPPPALEGSPASVRSICWIDNTHFGVVYVMEDTPNLFIVSTPKDSPHTYTNFYDVCLGNNSTPDQRYLLHLESSWGILVCASLDSIEVAVLGNMPNWVQWDLKEDGKALLPSKNGATHAVGMAVIYSAQRQLIISESESYPPMPVLFLLTNNGLLVSFHMVNASSSAPSLVSASQPLEAALQGAHQPIGAVQASPVPPQPSSMQPLMSSTFVTQSTPFCAKQDPQPSQLFQKVENASVLVKKESSSFLGGDGLHIKKPESATSALLHKIPVNNYADTAGMTFSMDKQTEILPGTQNSFIMAIMSEMQSFVRELEELRQLQSSTPVLEGEEADRSTLTTHTLNLHNFHKDMLDTMQALNGEIHTLKNVLLESFSMVEEAASRERRRHDHSYIAMLKDRALDPATARRLQRMHQRQQYLATQAQELNNRLDQDFVQLCSKKAPRGNLVISSTEAIYKTIVNNQKIIHNLRKKVQELRNKAEDRKLRNTTTSWGRYHKKSLQEDLSKLADAFLQVKVAHPEKETLSTTKKLSSQSQTILKEFLKQSNIVTVRPTAVYSPSQSRLLSNTNILSEDLSVLDQESVKDTSLQVNDSAKEKVPQAPPPPCEAEVTPPKMSLSFGKVDPPKAPVFEPITPPEVVNTSADKTFNATSVLRLSSECPPPLPLTNVLDSTVILSSEQKTSSNGMSSTVKSITESSQNTTSSVGKPLGFNKIGESVSSAPTSLFFSKTPSFSAATQKIPETNTSKTLSVSNALAVSSAASSFQFTSPFEPQKISSVASSTNTVISSSKISSQPEPAKSSGSLLFNPPNTSFSLLAPSLGQSSANLTSSTSTSFSLPSLKTSQVSSPSLFTLSENKNSSLFTSTGNKDQSATPQPGSRIEFFIQKSFENSSQPNVTILKKDTIPDSSSSTPVKETIVSSMLFNKTESIDSSKSLAQNSPSIGAEKTVADSSSSVSPSQTLFAAIQKTENTINQPTGNSTFSSFSDLKLSLSPPTTAPTLATTPNVPSEVSTVQETSQSTVLVASASSGNDVLSPSTSPATTSAESLSTAPSTLPVLSTTVTTVPASTTTTLFGLSTAVVTSAPDSKAETAPAPVFGTKSPPSFGQQASPSEMPSFFGTANSTPVSQPAPFGGAAPGSNFSSGGFFSQVPSFGNASAPTTTASDFNSQASTFSFGKPAFGQTTGSSFGLAKSFFGQNTTAFTQATAPTNSTSSFSFGSGGSFGQGSFFSGLGGKPSEENASKNVFGLSNNLKQDNSSNLFRNSSVTSFSNVNSGSTFQSSGSFSSNTGSVAQAGFGAFQQNTSPSQPSGGFGSAPSFGGAPTFGSVPAFGASPTFGSGNPLSSSVFGQTQQQVSSNFSNFANASSPTFGSLASQSSGFGSPPSMMGGFGSQQASGFGSAPVFGSSTFGGQSSGFGSPGSPPSNSSAFTQWRN